MTLVQGIEDERSGARGHIPNNSKITGGTSTIHSRNNQTNHDLRGLLIRPIFGLTQLPSGFLRFPQAFMIWLNDAVYWSSGES